jgi:hypothetical protein
MVVRLTRGLDGLKATILGEDGDSIPEGAKRLSCPPELVGTLQGVLTHYPLTLTPVSRLPAPPLIWSPRNPIPGPGHLMCMDEAGFSILGNAVLAAWWNGSHRQACRETDLRQEASQRTELRNLLEYEGVLDDAFTGPFRTSGEYVPESLSEFAQRLDAALNSAEWFARVSLNLVDFSRLDKVPPYLSDTLAVASPAERRTPIARLGPCTITRALRTFVIEYFRQIRAGHASTSGGPDSKGGPLSGPDRAREKTAVRVFEAVYQGNPAARLTKGQACGALAKHFPFAKARDRIWDQIVAPNWKRSGKPPRASQRVSLSILETKLSEALK